jgi:Peptidase family S41
MRIFILILFALPITAAYGQSSLPVLSKQQLYDDFDTLYQMLSTVNPHDYVRKTVNGYAMLDSIKSLRSKIENIHSAEDFYWLVNRALTLCQDGHTSTVSKWLYNSMTGEDRLKWHSTIADTFVIKQYSKLRKERIAAVNLVLPIKYINGEYVSLQRFYLNNNAIPPDAILRKVNGLSVHDFVRSKLQYKEELHWDFRNKRFYANDFYNAFDINLSEQINFEFHDGNKSIVASATLRDTAQVTEKLIYERQERLGKVRYYADERIIYIRMPVMHDSAFYLSQIDSLQTVLSASSVAKVIFDVRDNPGGNDGDWTSVLVRFLSKPVIRTIAYGLNRKNPAKHRIYADSFRILKNLFIKSGEFAEAINAPDTILPYKNKIGFAGKIYVVQNENCFSATGDLITTCQFSDQLINVGNSTGWFAGFGSMPWVFILPHSKILYWIEPLIDFGNARKPEDLFHNQVKMQVFLSAEDYLKRYSYQGDIYEKAFLLLHDPVIKRILLLQ